MKRKIILLVLSIIVSAVLFEASVRLFLPPTPLHPAPGESPGTLTGPLEPGNSTRTFRNSTGDQHTVTVKYHRHGFKRWGDTETNKTKVLILGDSHTEMHFVSNGEEWYSYLERALPEKEFFVYGGSGFGMVSEYLVLNRTVGTIEPDVVIVQFAGNDFRDNYLPSKKLRFPDAIGIKRPFLLDGEIKYRLGTPLERPRRASKTVDFLVSKYQIKAVKTDGIPKIDNLLGWEEGGKEEEQIERKASNETVYFLSKIGKRLGNASLYLLKMSGVVEPGERYRNICNKINYTCIGGIDSYIYRKSRELNTSLVSSGGHYNELGNLLAGEYLVEQFRENDTLSIEEN